MPPESRIWRRIRRDVVLDLVERVGEDGDAVDLVVLDQRVGDDGLPAGAGRPRSRAGRRAATASIASRCTSTPRRRRRAPSRLDAPPPAGRRERRRASAPRRWRAPPRRSTRRLRQRRSSVAVQARARRSRSRPSTSRRASASSRVELLVLQALLQPRRDRQVDRRRSRRARSARTRPPAGCAATAGRARPLSPRRRGTGSRPRAR